MREILDRLDDETKAFLHRFLNQLEEIPEDERATLLLAYRNCPDDSSLYFVTKKKIFGKGNTNEET